MKDIKERVRDKNPKDSKSGCPTSERTGSLSGSGSKRKAKGTT